MIDWTEIEQQFLITQQALMALLPAEQWAIVPQGVKKTRHKTKYGMADIHGWVHINQAFMGTDARRLLDVTLRHELTHLCVGLQHGHDAVFRKQAKLFGAEFGTDLAAEHRAVNQAIGCKYHLYAILADQQKVLYRQAHRKHAKYQNYRPGRFRYLTLNGVKVMGFYYESAA